MQLAILSGASTGIGRACAEKFLHLGFSVYNLSRRACPTPEVHNLTCDLADPASVNAAIAALLPAVQASTSVALVHNASQIRKDSTTDCADDALRAVLETNVVAINTLNRHLLPSMPRSSSVIYVGSTLSEKAVPRAFSYIVSKHAQLGIMRATCQDLLGQGIHTALVCPGFTDTEMLRAHIGNNQEIIQAIGAMNSFGRLIAPQEIADLIVWVHYNPVINGAVLHANLGQKEA